MVLHENLSHYSAKHFLWLMIALNDANMMNWEFELNNVEDVI